MQLKKGFTRLTLQPFLPKLRLTNQMQGTARKTSSLILLFCAAFLAVQFHYCCDSTPTPSFSHICPVCSASGSVVAASQTLVMAIVPVIHRLEMVHLVVSISAAVPRPVSPRAPPSL